MSDHQYNNNQQMSEHQTPLSQTSQQKPVTKPSAETPKEMLTGCRMCSKTWNEKSACCAFAMWYKLKGGNERVLVPLQDVSFTGTLESGHATLNAKLTYINPLQENPMECQFDLPIDKGMVVTKLSATINQQTIQVQIKSKDVAMEKYDDALATGKAAVYAEQSKNDDLTLMIGNLLPQATATIDIQVIMPLKVEGGAYELTLPVTFLPNYNEHQRLDGNTVEQLYTFQYCFNIVSKNQKITFMGSPEGSTQTETNDGYKIEAASCSEVPRKELKFHYKVEKMFQPRLSYVKQNEEYAVMVNLMPSFETKEAQELIKSYDGAPDVASLSKGEDFCFIFLVDRSGSMGGEGIEIAKQALELFIQSLPAGCQFSIISFGSEFKEFKLKTQTVHDYNDDTIREARKHISKMQANMGGTNILDPVQAACKQECGNRQKRIFLLTDGQVKNSKEIIDHAKTQNRLSRIHTFGLGGGADRHLCTNLASAGRGSASFSGEGNEVADLPGQVIKALQNSFEPSLADCSLNWPNRPVQFGELFRNSNVASYEIMTSAEFDKLQIKFKFKDCETLEENEFIIDKGKFQETTLPLFQLAASEMLNTSPTMKDDTKVEWSIRYQVLSRLTAFVGVVKSGDKITGELVHINALAKKEQMYMEEEPMLGGCSMEPEPTNGGFMQPNFHHGYDDVEMSEDVHVHEENKMSDKASDIAPFSNFISLQSSEGFWPESALSKILEFTKVKEIPQALLQSYPNIECQLTLIALCVLEEVFGNRAAEWLMIAQKAKAFLKQNNVDVKKDQKIILVQLF